MDWDKYFKVISEKEFFETIEKQYQYQKISKIVERLNGRKDDIEYTVIEDWKTKTSYIKTKEKKKIWKFLTYAFGDVKMINNDIFYIKTELETTFLYISASLNKEDNMMTMKIVINLTRCHKKNKELLELEEIGGYIMKKKCEEICEKIAEKMCREKCIRKIQRACDNWLWKPICKDGRAGINAKIGWRECEKIIKAIN